MPVQATFINSIQGKSEEVSANNSLKKVNHWSMINLKFQLKRISRRWLRCKIAYIFIQPVTEPAIHPNSPPNYKHQEVHHVMERVPIQTASNSRDHGSDVSLRTPSVHFHRKNHFFNEFNNRHPLIICTSVKIEKFEEISLETLSVGV